MWHEGSHSALMYTGSEKSWNGEGQDYDFVIWGDSKAHFFIMCVLH